jgi:hypothetical protein
VLFLCKNGEHQSFDDIYYIPRLTSNIVSVGQLNETGYDIHIQRGVVSVRELGGRLLSKIDRAKNRLYMFNVNIV